MSIEKASANQQTQQVNFQTTQGATKPTTSEETPKLQDTSAQQNGGLAGIKKDVSDFVKGPLRTATALGAIGLGVTAGIALLPLTVPLGLAGLGLGVLAGKAIAKLKPDNLNFEKKALSLGAQTGLSIGTLGCGALCLLGVRMLTTSAKKSSDKASEETANKSDKKISSPSDQSKAESEEGTGSTEHVAAVAGKKMPDSMKAEEKINKLGQMADAGEEKIMELSMSLDRAGDRLKTYENSLSNLVETKTENIKQKQEISFAFTVGVEIKRDGDGNITNADALKAGQNEGYKKLLNDYDKSQNKDQFIKEMKTSNEYGSKLKLLHGINKELARDPIDSKQFTSYINETKTTIQEKKKEISDIKKQFQNEAQNILSSFSKEDDGLLKSAMSSKTFNPEQKAYYTKGDDFPNSNKNENTLREWTQNEFRKLTG